MGKVLKCIMLVDDNKVDNFFHQRVIKKFSSDIEVISMESGQDALDYLTGGPSIFPDIIFLDINMPGMNGWEFIEHYNALDSGKQHSIIVVMLTTSGNPDEQLFAINNDAISELRTKPLTLAILEEVMEKLSFVKV